MRRVRSVFECWYLSYNWKLFTQIILWSFSHIFMFRFVVEVCLTLPLFTCNSSDIILMRKRISFRVSVLIFSLFLTTLNVTGRQANLSSSKSSRSSLNLLCHKISLLIWCLLNTTNVKNWSCRWQFSSPEIWCVLGAQLFLYRIRKPFIVNMCYVILR